MAENTRFRALAAATSPNTHPLVHPYLAVQHTSTSVPHRATPHSRRAGLPHHRRFPPRADRASCARYRLRRKPDHQLRVAELTRRLERLNSRFDLLVARINSRVRRLRRCRSMAELHGRVALVLKGFRIRLQRFQELCSLRRRLIYEKAEAYYERFEAQQKAISTLFHPMMTSPFGAPDNSLLHSLLSQSPFTHLHPRFLQHRLIP